MFPLHVFPFMFPLDTHNACFAMQSILLGRPVEKMESWEMMKTARPDPTKPPPAQPVYYNNAGEKKARYCAEYKKLYPEVEDPMTQPIDETAMMLAGGGTHHGRSLCASGSFKSTRTFSQIKATLPSSITSTARTRQPRRDVSLPLFHHLLRLEFMNG